jgi:hypothetical protein
MLPILRIIPVGGVFLAIMILVLALDPPGGLHRALPSGLLPARGALLQADEHPEWRQFLMLAAIRRADALSRLRDLPSAPGRTGTAPDLPMVAGLPANRSDTDPDDETGTISEMPSVTIPVEIGETSSTELPVTTLEETPSVFTTPERRKAPSERRKKSVHRVRPAKTPAKPEPAAQFNLLEALFGGLQPKQPATARAVQR